MFSFEMFSFVPDDAPPRLVRFDKGALGWVGGSPIVALLDTENNLLVIDRALFRDLSEGERSFVLKTQETCLTKADIPTELGERWTVWPAAERDVELL